MKNITPLLFVFSHRRVCRAVPDLFCTEPFGAATDTTQEIKTGKKKNKFFKLFVFACTHSAVSSLLPF